MEENAGKWVKRKRKKIKPENPESRIPIIGSQANGIRQVNLAQVNSIGGIADAN